YRTPSATQMRPSLSMSMLVGLRSSGDVAQTVTSSPSGSWNRPGGSSTGSVRRTGGAGGPWKAWGSAASSSVINSRTVSGEPVRRRIALSNSGSGAAGHRAAMDVVLWTGPGTLCTGPNGAPVYCPARGSLPGGPQPQVHDGSHRLCIEIYVL